MNENSETKEEVTAGSELSDGLGAGKRLALSFGAVAMVAAFSFGFSACIIWISRTKHGNSIMWALTTSLLCVIGAWVYHKLDA